MSAWRLVVNFLLPPPLVLTVLLILPSPLVVKKGLLIFTKNFLFYPIEWLNFLVPRAAGQVRLVHLCLGITGLAFVASSFHTHKLGLQGIPDGLSSNQQLTLKARRWREERNFWIACLTFLLWGLLYRFYTLMLEYQQVKERVKYLEAVVAKIPAGNPAGQLPSAPPLPEEVPLGAGSKGVTGVEMKKIK